MKMLGAVRSVKGVQLASDVWADSVSLSLSLFNSVFCSNKRTAGEMESKLKTMPTNAAQTNSLLLFSGAIDRSIGPSTL
jgi:hypothetical protein